MTIMKQRCLHLQTPREGEAFMNIHQTVTISKENKRHGSFEDLHYKDLPYKCSVFVIVCAKVVNSGITNKFNCCCLHQVVNSGIHN